MPHRMCMHSSVRTCNRFLLLTLQHISPPSREELNLFRQSFLCTAIGIHKPFLLHYCFQRKLTASSNFVLMAICFLVFLLYKLPLSHNSVHSAEPALTSFLLHQGFLSRGTWQHRARDRSQRTWPQTPPYKCLTSNHSTHGLV